MLGIVEAKKVSVNPQNGLEQASDTHAACSMQRVNGKVPSPFPLREQRNAGWHLDARPENCIPPAERFPHARSTRIKIHHDTPRQGRLPARYSTEQIQTSTLSARLHSRRRTGDNGRKADMMVAMATGTGKTFLTVAQIYRLLESKLVRRISVSRRSQSACGPSRPGIQRLQHAEGKQVHSGVPKSTASDSSGKTSARHAF